jgi:predicted DNA-binding protein (UPF0251 family)
VFEESLTARTKVATGLIATENITIKSSDYITGYQIEYLPAIRG